ncbi:Uncharacterised protein [Serratia rubidaea]|uniref:Uncharacterized protein n=1 Tax=Serratia rubidaea TaxID=61652 RepID=A0A4U9HV93_SERRU|nr:Uncharacterised protein [Serratia rubidaea]
MDVVTGEIGLPSRLSSPILITVANAVLARSFCCLKRRKKSWKAVCISIFVKPTPPPRIIGDERAGSSHDAGDAVTPYSRLQPARADTERSDGQPWAFCWRLFLSARCAPASAAAGDRPADTAPAPPLPHHPLPRPDDRAATPAYGTAKPAGYGGFSACPARFESLDVAARSSLPISWIWRRRPSFLIFCASSMAARRSSSSGMRSSAFSPNQPARCPGLLTLRHRV